MAGRPTLRQEPFRLFFPLGIVLAGAGVVPWLLFARGAFHTWPGLPHALTMSQGFFIAVAIGFLGTILPRRTQTRPLSSATLSLLALGIVVSAAAQLAGYVIVAELSTMGQLFLLVSAAARRVGRGTLPSSFVLVAAGVLAGAVGAGLLVAAALGAPEVTLRVGRALVAQGTLLGLVLGTTPLLASIVLRGQQTVRTGRALGFAAAAAILLGSFALDEIWTASVGLGVRSALALGIIVWSGALAAAKPGVHRVLFRLALLLVPVGLAAAALAPERRLALLHVVYGGGFALLVIAVTIHVALFHGGRERLADGWPIPVILVAGLALAAVAVRACLEGFGAGYLGAMTVAASLWLGAVAAWAGFLAPKLIRRARP